MVSLLHSSSNFFLLFCPFETYVVLSSGMTLTNYNSCKLVSHIVIPIFSFNPFVINPKSSIQYGTLMFREENY